MQKSLSETETGEPGGARRHRKARRIMACERNVEGEPLVQRQRRAADAGIVQGAAMARIDPERRVHRGAQRFQCVEGFGPDDDFAAAGTGDLARREMRPAGGIPQSASLRAHDVGAVISRK
jgi:hypothetical protein